MTTKTTCDIPGCHAEGVTVVELKSSRTTPLMLDVCDAHLAEWKAMVRRFTGQEVPDWKLENADG